MLMTGPEFVSFVADIVNILVVGGGFIYAVVSFLRVLWQRMKPTVVEKSMSIATLIIVLISGAVFSVVLVQITGTMREVALHNGMIQEMLERIYIIDNRVSGVERQLEPFVGGVPNTAVVLYEQSNGCPEGWSLLPGDGQIASGTAYLGNATYVFCGRD